MRHRSAEDLLKISRTDSQDVAAKSPEHTKDETKSNGMSIDGDAKLVNKISCWQFLRPISTQSGVWISQANSLFPVHMLIFCDVQTFGRGLGTIRSQAKCEMRNAKCEN